MQNENDQSDRTRIYGNGQRDKQSEVDDTEGEFGRTYQDDERAAKGNIHQPELDTTMYTPISIDTFGIS